MVRGVQQQKNNNKERKKKKGAQLLFITDECVRFETSRFLARGPPATVGEVLKNSKKEERPLEIYSTGTPLEEHDVHAETTPITPQTH